MQGLGNDFICLDYDKVSRYNLKIFSKYICDRHLGIGADGVLLYSKSKIADCKMRIFNSDGTEAGMCGNGIRCLSRFIYEKGYVPKNKMKIETISGIKNIECITQNAKIRLSGFCLKYFLIAAILFIITNGLPPDLGATLKSSTFSFSS